LALIIERRNTIMTIHRNTTDLNAAIEELRRLAREPYQPAPELQRLRHRISSERKRVHQGILERVAKQAGVDLQPIFEEARRRNAAKRQYVTRTLERLEAKAVERAATEKKQFHRIRSEYIATFNQLEQSTPQLKFHEPMVSSESAQPGQCNLIFGSACSDPSPGNYEARADVRPDPNGIWLLPLITNDNGDCDETLPGTTLQDLTYRMATPTRSFAVNSIRVDLIGNGVATSVFGDAGYFAECNSLFVHSFIDMDVLIAQQVNGIWQQWPLVSDRLFAGQGEYAKQIRLVLSGQTYPAAFVVRTPEIGGGDLLCHLQLVCSAQACGTDGRNGMDFQQIDLGIFVGGVALLGDFV
jgi:hypothetical protein